MDDPLTAVEATGASSGDLAGVARGGALNLAGAVVYGAANFALVVVVTNALGVTGTGQFLIAVAIFNILVKVAELGAATGFIRMISRELALGRSGNLPALTIAGLVPVAAVGTGLAVASWLVAPSLATLFGAGNTAEVTTYVRTLAPFLPVMALYSVVIQGTRGFGTMRPQAFVEKIGKALIQPVAAFAVLAGGAGPRGLALAWVLPGVVAAVPAALWFRVLVRRASVPSDAAPDAVSQVSRAFWRFAAPRAVGQVFQVTVLWFDTLLIGVLLGAGQAGIYAAATRYLLVGTFVAEAIMQVVGPRVSSLVALGERSRALRIYQAATGWQVLGVWPAFLIIAAFSPVLLGFFGAGFTDAVPALTLLAVAMLASSVFGPSDTVVLMSGRSTLSLFNTVVSVVVNVGGNLVLTPRYGLTGAALAWSASMLVTGALPAAQAWRGLKLHPFGTGTGTAAAVSVVAVGGACLAMRAVAGPSLAGLVGAAVLGGAALSGLAWRARRRLDLEGLAGALRARSGRRTAGS